MDFNNDENLDSRLNKVASQVIKDKRLKKGLSLDEVITKMNNIITKQSLFRYENNEARMKNTIFKEICYALKEDPQDVWNEINSKLLNYYNFDNVHPTILSNNVKIPVYGTIKAGTPIEAQTDIIDYVDIPKEWTRGDKKYFGLRISGDSMSPKYLDNDLVIFESTQDYEIANGKDCAVMVDSSDVTFKNVSLNHAGITLIPLNLNNSDNYQPTFYDNEQIEKLPIKIIGIAREKRSKV